MDTLQIFLDLKGMSLIFHLLVSFVTMNWGKGVAFCLFIFFNASFEESREGISGMEEKLIRWEWGIPEVLLRTMHSLRVQNKLGVNKIHIEITHFFQKTFSEPL